MRAEGCQPSSTPGRRRRAILRRAEVLLAASEETSIIETIFDEAGLIELEFIGLLKSVVEGREVAWRRITEIAATIAPRLSIPRGPKISAASATHEVFLETVAELLAPRAYTRDPISEIYTDRWTAATRQEFRDPDFNPQAAHLRAKARRAAKKSRLRPEASGFAGGAATAQESPEFVCFRYARPALILTRSGHGGGDGSGG